jgi:hypothetical protein
VNSPFVLFRYLGLHALHLTVNILGLIGASLNLTGPPILFLLTSSTFSIYRYLDSFPGQRSDYYFLIS